MTTSTYESSYRLKKNGIEKFDPLLRKLYPIVKILSKIKEPLIEGLENIPKTGPLLVLPKHRYYVDIAVIWGIIRKADRYPNYIMKSDLPGIFSYLNGIKLNRLMDIMSKLKDARKSPNPYGARRKIIIDAKKVNQSSLDYMAHLLKNGEVVISFPEGTFYNNGVGPIKPDKVIRTTIELQNKLDRKIGIIPIGTEYKGKSQSDVYVKIGKPFTLDDFTRDFVVDEKGLVRKIHQEISLLSGF